MSDLDRSHRDNENEMLKVGVLIKIEVLEVDKNRKKDKIETSNFKVELVTSR